ncbi:MAG: hypothetical protein ACYDD1_22250 [Caulobacteraceae bacterium]
MVTAELLRVAHEKALASLTEAQRAAVDLMIDTRTQLSFSAPTTEVRLMRQLHAEAASVNRQLMCLPAPTE